MMLLAIALTLAAVASLPYWFPRYLGKMRLHLFRQLFGAQGVELPSAEIGPEESLRLYGHSEAYGLSDGAVLSELTWYWAFPAPHLHQELMEPGPLYDLANKTTRKLLAVRPDTLFPMLEKHFNLGSAKEVREETWTNLRLTPWLFPTFAAVFYELIFGREATAEILDILTAYVANDLRTRKCLELRNLPLRERARDTLAQAMDHATRERLLPLSAELSSQELAGYVLVNFFATGVIQLSEMLAHVFLEVGRDKSVRARLASEGYQGRYLTILVKEIIRLYPLFDTSHRILRAAVTLANGRVLPEGTVLYLNHAAYNRAAFADGDTFRPERWNAPEAEQKSIAFGLKENRGCPAHGFAMNVVRFMVPLLLQKYDFRSSAKHVRALANFAPCCVSPKSARSSGIRTRLLAMKVVDDWHGVATAGCQLVLGKYMAWRAISLQPATKYFATAHEQRELTPARRA